MPLYQSPDRHASWKDSGTTSGFLFLYVLLLTIDARFDGEFISPDLSVLSVTEEKKIDLCGTDKPEWRTVFSLASKFFISVVTGTLFSYTVELFPTSTRSSALGVCSSMGKVGAIMAPSLAEMVRLSTNQSKAQ